MFFGASPHGHETPKDRFYSEYSRQKRTYPHAGRGKCRSRGTTGPAHARPPIRRWIIVFSWWQVTDYEHWFRIQPARYPALPQLTGSKNAFAFFEELRSSHLTSLMTYSILLPRPLRDSAFRRRHLPGAGAISLTACRLHTRWRRVPRGHIPREGRAPRRMQPGRTRPSGRSQSPGILHH